MEQADSDDGAICPDLVLLDLNLPRTTGSRVLMRIKQSPQVRRYSDHHHHLIGLPA